MIRVLLIGEEAAQWAERLRGFDSEELEVVDEELPAAGVRRFGEASPDAVVIAESPGSSRVAPLLEALDEKPLAALVPMFVVGGHELEATVDVDGFLAGFDRGGPDELLERLADRLDADFEEPEGSSSYSEVESSREIDVERSRPGVDEAGLAMSSTEIPAPQAEVESREGSGETRREDPASEEVVERRDYVIEPLESSAANESANELANESVNESANKEEAEPTGQESDAAEAREPRREESLQGERGRSVGPEAIRRKLKEVRHEDYYTILEVERNVDREEVREAYRRLASRFNPRTMDPDVAERFGGALDEIEDAIDDARAVLGDERLREAYLESTTRK